MQAGPANRAGPLPNDNLIKRNRFLKEESNGKEQI
jgi:hypothetical protein